MQEFTVEEARAACGGEYLSEGAGRISGVAIDSRKVARGTLFAAIKGERSDGRDYIDKAFEAGAVCALSEGRGSALGAVIGTDNTVRALGEIAKAYKMKYNVPTVGVTGSVGKTTTKDMISAVLAKKCPTLKTEGNFNNELGLPLTVFGLEKHHGAAVLEMGMSARGEIHYLADIARPDVVVISNVGMSHIENLGSREEILRAKMEITDFFGSENLLIINADNDMLRTVDKNAPYRILTYAIENDADYRAENIRDYSFGGSEFTANTPSGNFRVRVKTPGLHNVLNALSAIAVGQEFGVSSGDIAAAIEEYEPTAMRMEVENAGGITLICDCYNASPDSIAASLAVLAGAQGRRVAFLGDVLELGEFSEKAHRGIGEMCANKADLVVCAGENARYIAESARAAGCRCEYFETTDEAAENACALVTDGDTVLVKASRGMHFEKICDALRERSK